MGVQFYDRLNASNVYGHNKQVARPLKTPILHQIDTSNQQKQGLQEPTDLHGKTPLISFPIP